VIVFSDIAFWYIFSALVSKIPPGEGFFAPDLILVSDEPFALADRLGRGDVENKVLKYCSGNGPGSLDWQLRKSDKYQHSANHKTLKKLQGLSTINVDKS